MSRMTIGWFTEILNDGKEVRKSEGADLVTK
jgi:hypothetical protein